jgi:hypothetical protein
MEARPSERPVDEFNMVLPSRNCYSDINSDTAVPQIDMESLVGYFSMFEKTYEEKYRTMYSEGYVASYKNKTGIFM